MERPLIVTICGSTRFKDQYLSAMKMLEEHGHAVFAVGSFMHADGIPYNEEQKRALDHLHKKKIEMSDWIFVLNVGGYIGESTASEILHAISLAKTVKFLEPKSVPEEFKRQDLKELDIRPEVTRYAKAMEKKLRKNDHKHQWLLYDVRDIQWFLDRLKGEVEELEDALKSGSADDVADEAADVGNFAMMIMDIRSKEG